MKRLLSLLLVCILLLSLGPAALADTETTELEADQAKLNEDSKTIALKAKGEDYYQLIDAKGKVLVPASEEYIDMDPWDSFFEVEKASEDELPRKGLLAGDGTVLVPAKYHDVDVLSERWQIGRTVTPSEKDDSDYSIPGEEETYIYDESAGIFVQDPSNFTYYQIESTDFYYKGEYVGTLPRSQCYGLSLVAYGDYICVYSRTYDFVFYNNKLERSPYQSDSYAEYNWESVDGERVWYHQGTGQVAFRPDCSLEPEELACPYLYDEGVLYDIKGKEIARFSQEYEEVFGFEDGYAFADFANGLYGVVNLKGEEIIPLEYENLGDCEQYLFRFGYICFVREDESGFEIGFLNDKGQVTCHFRYTYGDPVVYGPFARLQAYDGSFYVLSAAVGRIPEPYSRVYFPGEYGCRAFVAENTRGEMGVVDLEGKTLLPFSDQYEDIQLSTDGTVALVSLDDDQYVIYRF